MTKLQTYSWPGNIRELQHWVERAIIMSDTHELGDDDFQPRLKKLTNPIEQFQDSPDRDLESIEKNTILKALSTNGGHLSRAAGDLGISRFKLYRKMEKFGIKKGK
jgi:two-component system response regulator HydG